MLEFNPWPSIERLHNVQKRARTKNIQQTTYRAKVKLHGTNASVLVSPDGRAFPKSRSRFLTPEEDNFGFCVWALQQSWPTLGLWYDVFGEWVGPGVQQGTALSKLPERTFAVFAANINGRQQLIHPVNLQCLFPQRHVVPWHGEQFSIDWHSDNEAVLRSLNEQVADIDRQCPWAKSVFAADGPGEGLVCYPLYDSRELMFKVKGDSHAKGGRADAKMTPSVSADVIAFAEQFATVARFEQFAEPGRPAAATGDFIRSVLADVQREGADELTASGLAWQSAAAEIAKRARTWYLQPSL